MEKKLTKTRHRDTDRAARVSKVADLCRVSNRTVERVISGDQKNEEVLSAYMFMAESENRLLQIARQLVPFHKPKKTSNIETN